MFQGVHTFSSTAKYIGYVISKLDNVTNTAYGYLTGFNKSKLQTYSPYCTLSDVILPATSTVTTTTPYTGPPTTRGIKIYTTTRSASKMNLNLITISLLLISKIFFFQ
uniref:Uncharacterized protein n=1 Tax=Strongyloides papillosus TaxID=174720 RepID=A0A0N5BKJ5_STREA